MLFTKLLMFIYDNPLMNIIVAIAFIWFCIWAYKKSVASRRYYKCPQCGESFRSEHMEAKICKVCGADLEKTLDTDVNDRAV